MKFIDRKEELKELGTLSDLSGRKLFVVVLYGLRRVGKTRLLLEFLKNRGAYFFVNKNKASSDLLMEFQEILRAKGTIGELESIPSWDKFFETLLARGVSPVVLDEFQNFASVQPSVFGILQKVIDLNEGKRGLIIISGSLIGMMKRLFQGSKEPLYGRIKASRKLEPLSLQACLQIGDELGLRKEELVKLYILFGGYPKYYVAVEDFGLQGRATDDIISALFFDKSAPLEEEANGILSQELGGRSGVYYSILEAIATGNNTVSSIAGYLNAPTTSITRQVNELREFFEFIELEMPYVGKRGIYVIKHPLLEFWFSQIYRNFSDYAARNPEFLDKVRKNLNTFYGRGFERVAREFLVSELGLSVARRQWGKAPQNEKGKETYEIDLIGRIGKETYVFEFKWKELASSDALGILRSLEAKARYVKGLPPGTKFGIMAKKIEGKKDIKGKGYIAYDLDDVVVG